MQENTFAFVESDHLKLKIFCELSIEQGDKTNRNL